ncbi:hypothetical protein PIIN_10178 [Serendipita indica DSM 11827]|uniref:Uncharacterized protein n=1 Tax=Serendipita indica (strain DSM 11827) TaxID=1109443 RepID=G4TXZ2_SERID|nr:hypothetical protein PIIN_10178 [Serendipita indica DSM 11827]
MRAIYRDLSESGLRRKRIISELKPSKRSQHALNLCALSSKPKAVRHVKEGWPKRIWDAFFAVVVMLGCGKDAARSWAGPSIGAAAAAAMISFRIRNV